MFEEDLYLFFIPNLKTLEDLMKRLLTALLALFMTAGTLSAQDVFRKNDVAMNMGVGYNNTLTMNFNTIVPPISVSVEYGIVDNPFNEEYGSIGVGGYLGYTSYGYKNNSRTASYTILGARGSYHFQFFPKLDTYGGLLLGLAFRSGDLFENDVNTNNARLAYGIFIGGRYMFHENIGAFAEVGWGVSAINLGLALKF